MAEMDQSRAEGGRMVAPHVVALRVAAVLLVVPRVVALHVAALRVAAVLLVVPHVVALRVAAVPAVAPQVVAAVRGAAPPLVVGPEAALHVGEAPAPFPLAAHHQVVLLGGEALHRAPATHKKRARPQQSSSN